MAAGKKQCGGDSSPKRAIGSGPWEAPLQGPVGSSGSHRRQRSDCTQQSDGQPHPLVRVVEGRVLQCGTGADPFAADTSHGSGNVFVPQPSLSHMPVRPMVAPLSPSEGLCDQLTINRAGSHVLVLSHLRVDLNLSKQHSCRWLHA